MMLMARITNRTDFTCKLWWVIDTIEVFLNTKNMYFTLKNEIETEASLSVFNQTVIEPTFWTGSSCTVCTTESNVIRQ